MQTVKGEKVKLPRNVDEKRKREAEKTKALARAESLENAIKEINLSMADHRLDYEELNKLFCKKEALSKELDQVMELWLSVL